MSGLSAATKIYDGTTSAVVTGTSALAASEAAGTGTTSDGKPYTGDTVNITGTAVGTYNSKDVLTAATVTFSGLTLGGTHANNYTLTIQSPVAATITPKALSMTGLTAPASKVYDGTTNSAFGGAAALLAPEAVGTGTTSDGKPYIGDAVNVSGPSTASYNSKHVDIATTVSFSGLSLINTHAPNYTLTAQTIPSVITAKPITVTAITNSKQYDGATTAAAIPTNSGVASGDTASFIEAYSNKNFGLGNKTLVPSGVVTDGNSGDNYSYTFVNFLTGTITKLPVVVDAIDNTKVYDGTITAAAVPTNSGVAVGDTANFIETYSDKHIGSGNKTLVASGTVSDDNSGLNYSYGFNSFTTGTITARPITVTAVANTKVYDGTNLAAALPTHASLGTGDTAGFTEVYTDPNVGTSKVMSPLGVVTDGNGGANYTYTYISSPLGTITKTEPTVTAVGGSFLFTGSPIAGSGSAVGVLSEVLSPAVTLSYSGTGSTVYGPTATPPTAIGTYSVTASFAGNSNYNPKVSTPAALTIDSQYTPTVAVDCGTNVVTYPNSISCTVTVTRPYGTFTPSGTVAWTTNGAGSFGVTTPCGLIAGAGGASTCSATYTVTAVGTGTHTLTAAYSGDANFAPVNGTKDVTVNKADASITWPTAGAITYPQTLAASVLSGGSATPTGTFAFTAPTTVPDAGTAPYSVTFTPTNPNYNTATHMVSVTVAQATSAVLVTCPLTEQTYTGSALTPCTASYSGAGGLSGSLTPTYSNNTNVGTATANAVYAGDINHTGSSNSAIFVIGKAPSTVTVTCPASVTFTGLALTPCTASYSGAGGLSGSLTPTYSNNTNVGTATANATYAGDANHNGSSNSANFDITQATPTLFITNPVVVFTGSPQAAVLSAAPVAGSFSNIKYNSSSTVPSAIGVYAVTANFTSSDPNFMNLTDAAAGNFEISDRLPQTITFGALASKVITDPDFSVTATASSSLPVDFSTTTTGVCTVTSNGATVHLVAVGTCTITAHQGGDATYNPAPDVSQSFVVTNVPITLPAGWVGGIAVTSDKNVVSVGRPHVGSEIASYDGFSTAGAHTAYIPMLFRGAYGGTYNAAFYIQNVDAGTANITISYYDSTGALTCSAVDTITTQASKGYWLPGTCVPAGWVGGAVVTSDQNIVAIGRPHIGAEVMTYNSFSSGSLTSYVPMLFKGAFGGTYNAAFYVQNVGAASADLTIKYYDSTGALTCTATDTIATLASKGYWLPGTCVPANWVGGAVITSTEPIVTVGRPHIGTQITTYNGFSAGSGTSYVPMLFKGAFGGTYNAAFYVQNVGASPANISVKYYDLTGALTCTATDTVASLASKGYWLPGTCVPANWVGGAVVTSDQDIVTVGRPHIGAQVTTYDGFTSGSMASYLPMLFKAAYGGTYNAAYYIQNTEATAATVITKFYDSTGALTCSRNDTLAAFSTLSLWAPNLTCIP